MSFWDIGEEINATGKFEVGGGEPIPANTALKSMIASVQWDEYNGSRFIKVEWKVVDGQYKNRVVFQKIHVMDGDSAKRARAVKMLAAIDANSGGGLFASKAEPTDASLAQNLANKIMWIKVGVWEAADKSKSGNWVQAVSGGGAGNVQSAPAPAPVAAPVADDDIPF